MRTKAATPQTSDSDKPVTNPQHNTREAAKYIFGPNGSKSTLDHWRLRRVGPKWYKIGGVIRYYQNDLDDYIASCARGPSDQE
jgi:hypothetical protein